ncbi:MAG: DUF5752 family protein [Nanobdellota archaeon]
MSSLDRVDKDQEFIVITGENIASLYGLRDNLRRMDEATFAHHVNAERNDFANWVRHVIGDNKLAEKMESTISREEARKIVDSRIREIKKPKKTTKKSSPKRTKKKTAEKSSKKIREEDLHPYSKRGIAYHKKDFHKHRSRPPENHEYMRGKHEHVHFNLQEFIYGVIVGASVTVIILRMLALI